MTLPQTTFVTNHQTEANRLIHVLVSTANGFYFRKKFAVLPYIIEGNAAVTYLPPLPFHKIKNGWQKWANLNRLDIPLNYPND